MCRKWSKVNAHKTPPDFHLQWNVFLKIKHLHWYFYCFIWDDMSKNRASCFITGSKHLEKDESVQPLASCFYPFLRVWTRDDARIHRSSHITWKGINVKLYLSGKLPTYPSPKLIFCPKWEVSVYVELGKGRVGSSQKRTMLPKLIKYLRGKSMGRTRWIIVVSQLRYVV